METTNRTAFITGGASGIGLGMAQAFGAAGMRIFLTDANATTLAAAADMLRGSGIDVASATLDVTQEDQWGAAYAAAVTRFGQVDVLCNNAGVMQGVLDLAAGYTTADLDSDYWRLILDVNINGNFLGVRTVVPDMVKRRSGHVVATASTAALVALPGIAAYTASKFAILGLAETLRAELAPHNVGVSVLCPGSVESNLVQNTSIQRSAKAPSSLGKPPFDGRVSPEGRRRMSAVKVGERVLAAIRANEFYIMTHADFGPLVEERARGQVASFGASAEPDYHETEGMIGAIRNAIYWPPGVPRPAGKA